MSNIKILFIINSLKKKSGTERVTSQLANALLKHNYSITIINRDTNHSDCAYPIDNRVNVLALQGGNLSFLRNLQKSIHTEQYDYVVIHNMGRLSLLCSLLNIPNNTKAISLEHVAFSSRSFLVRFLSKYRYKKINQVICLTENDKHSLDAIHSNVKVINNFSPFKISNNTNKNSNKIIAIGRLTEQKNFSHLISAWEIASKLLPHWSLDIYGEGDLKQELIDQIKRSQIQNVTLKGTTPNMEIVYQTASFLVMSSKFEGLPMVLIEAQSFGLPIISYDCPHGPKEIIQHEVNGYLVENQNINELSKTIVKLASSTELQQKMSLASLKIAQNYQPDKILKTWVNEVFK